MVKPYVIDRKNFFSKSGTGAEASATMMTVIQTALRNGLIPKQLPRVALRELGETSRGAPDVLVRGRARFLQGACQIAFFDRHFEHVEQNADQKHRWFLHRIIYGYAINDMRSPSGLIRLMLCDDFGGFYKKGAYDQEAASSSELLPKKSRYVRKLVNLKILTIVESWPIL